jgi:hypothetical protein
MASVRPSHKQQTDSAAQQPNPPPPNTIPYWCSLTPFVKALAVSFRHTVCTAVSNVWPICTKLSTNVTVLPVTIVSWRYDRKAIPLPQDGDLRSTDDSPTTDLGEGCRPLRLFYDGKETNTNVVCCNSLESVLEGMANTRTSEVRPTLEI